MFLHKSGPPLILLVDDEPFHADIAAYIAYELGCDFDSASSGREALKKVAERPPDIVLLDVRMPDLSGYEVCRRIKTDPATAGIQVIFVSARNDEEGVLQGFDALANDYITKPFSPREFKARAKNALRTKELLDTLLARTRFLELQQEITDKLEDPEIVDETDFEFAVSSILNKVTAFFGAGGASLHTRQASRIETKLSVSHTWAAGNPPGYLSALTLAEDPRIDRAPRLPGESRDASGGWVILSAPLWIGDSLTGTLRLHREGVFDPPEQSSTLEHLVALASHFARTLYRARMMEELRSRVSTS